MNQGNRNRPGPSPSAIESSTDKQFHPHHTSQSVTPNLSDQPRNPPKTIVSSSELNAVISGMPSPLQERDKERTYFTTDFYPFPLKVPLSMIFLINNNFFPHFVQARPTFEVPYERTKDKDDMELFPLENQMDRVPWLKTPNGVYDYVDPYFEPHIHHENELWKAIYTSVGWMMTEEEERMRQILQNHTQKARAGQSGKDSQRKAAQINSLKQQVPPGFEYNEHHIQLLREVASIPQSRISLLTNEIRNYASFILLTKAEYLARFTLIERITESVNFLDSSLLVYVYGSFSSYTSLPQSDVDLTIITLEQYKYIRRIQRAIRSLFEAWYGNPQDKNDLGRQQGYLSTAMDYYHSDAVRKTIQGLIHLDNQDAKICRICYGPLFTAHCRCDPDVAIAIEMNAEGESGAWMETPDESNRLKFCSETGVVNMKQLLSIQLSPRLQHRLDFSAPLICSRSVNRYPNQLISSTISEIYRLRNVQRVKEKDLLEKYLYMTPAEQEDRRRSYHLRKEREAASKQAQQDAQNQMQQTLAQPQAQQPTQPPNQQSPQQQPQQQSPQQPPPTSPLDFPHVQKQFHPSPSFVEELKTRQFALPPYPKNDGSDFLFQLREHLDEQDVVTKAELITGARVRIIKITDERTGVQCDVGFGSLSGIINTDFLRCLLVVYPQASELVLLLKAFIARVHLNEPYTGGLGGYALSLMVVSHLQQFSRNFGRRFEKEQAGQLLITFFLLYGEMDELPTPPNNEPKFSFNRFGLSVRGQGSYFDVDELRRTKPDMFAQGPELIPIFIEDPLDPTNNTARTCFKYARIQQHFREAYQQLMLPLAKPISQHCFERIRENRIPLYHESVRAYGTQMRQKKQAEKERRRREEMEEERRKEEERQEEERRQLEEQKRKEEEETKDQGIILGDSSDNVDSSPTNTQSAESERKASATETGQEEGTDEKSNPATSPHPESQHQTSSQSTLSVEVPQDDTHSQVIANTDKPSNPEHPSAPTAVHATPTPFTPSTHSSIPNSYTLFVPSQSRSLTSPVTKDSAELAIPTILGRIIQFDSDALTARRSTADFLNRSPFFNDPVTQLKQARPVVPTQHPHRIALQDTFARRVEMIQHINRESIAIANADTSPLPDPQHQTSPQPMGSVEGSSEYQFGQPYANTDRTIILDHPSNSTVLHATPPSPFPAPPNKLQPQSLIDSGMLKQEPGIKNRYPFDHQPRQYQANTGQMFTSRQVQSGRGQADIHGKGKSDNLTVHLPPQFPPSPSITTAGQAAITIPTNTQFILQKQNKPSNSAHTSPSTAGQIQLITQSPSQKQQLTFVAANAPDRPLSAGINVILPGSTHSSPSFSITSPSKSDVITFQARDHPPSTFTRYPPDQPIPTTPQSGQAPVILTTQPHLQFGPSQLPPGLTPSSYIQSPSTMSDTSLYSEDAGMDNRHLLRVKPPFGQSPNQGKPQRAHNARPGMAVGGLTLVQDLLKSSKQTVIGQDPIDAPILGGQHPIPIQNTLGSNPHNTNPHPLLQTPPYQQKNISTSSQHYQPSPPPPNMLPMNDSSLLSEIPYLPQDMGRQGHQSHGRDDTRRYRGGRKNYDRNTGTDQYGYDGQGQSHPYSRNKQRGKKNRLN
ncbi:putative sigma DNA polymerase [Blattamonas nauphoetae]|uniref:Sigma DNA polymerase n=1 Tax=Blattamonas nauphoetae TaxID=2049346 RepID=A0ABQ9XIM0_9EUKA|nr:putative sigma DNA polymerase [Blattamonas nauphoetae]